MIHHTLKNDPSKPRGSGDILASVDLSYVITKDRKTEDLHLKTNKNRMGEEFELVLRPDIHNGDFVVVTSEEESKTDRDLTKLSKMIRDNPRINQSTIFEKSGLPQKRCLALLQEGLNTYWTSKKGAKNATEFTIMEFKLEN